MARFEMVRARPISVVAALLLVVLSIGVSGSASADPDNGNGNGNGAENSALAQQDSGSNGKSADSSASIKSQSSNAGTDGTSGTSGVVTEPQPLSNADLNEGGANGQCTGGVYCSTRDGSPSLNGNGGGEATGKPCAGCVGKADNKNPQGQMPNARTDGNNGYECDGNNGIAKGNPAHTGCTTPPSVCVGACGNPPPPDCVGACGNPPPVCVESSTETCGNRPPGVRPRPPAEVAGVDAERPPAEVAGVSAERPPAAVPASPPAAVLPATGSPDLLGLVGGGGMGLLMAGGLTIWLHRRNRVIS